MVIKSIRWSLVILPFCAWACEADVVPVVFMGGVQVNYQDNTRVEVTASEAADLVVACTRTSVCETAWQITSVPLVIPEDCGGYALGFEVMSSVEWTRVHMSKEWGSDLTWFDASGKELLVQAFQYCFHKSEFARFGFCGTVPAGAASVKVRLGTDGPNINSGENVVFRKIRMKWLPKGTAIPANIAPDLEPPLVKSLFVAPTPDANVVARYEFIDMSDIDWSSVSVSNVRTKVAIPYERDGNVITLKPDVSWDRGINSLVISVRDVFGNGTLSRKAFLIGEKANVAVVRLRDDGVTLIDGRPFFPIGMYGIKLDRFNAWDFDRALGDLRKGGFNFAHSYTSFRDPEFLRLADKHGFKAWTGAYRVDKGDDWLVSTGRYDKATITWYIGDDTAMYVKPSELLDRDEAARMLDGTRLTCQADAIHSDSFDDGYGKYMDYTDVFLPEIYPILGDDKAADDKCVAVTIRDMRRAIEDIAKGSDGKRAHAVWPILQIFHGKLWHRYPTSDETYATTFASLIHGGKGVTWFHYAGNVEKEFGRSYSGCYRTQESWCMTTNMATRIAELSSVLVERDPAQPAAPVVLEGPTKDPLGQPAVTALMKRHKDSVYLLAVNASPRAVRARLNVLDAADTGEVLWEGRKVSVSGNSFEDSFGGFGVHVYRIGVK